jgi:hypothetical protein
VRTTKRIVALATIAAFSQTACYNTYFITKDELRKLESSVEQEEVVTVYGDCPEGTVAIADIDRPLYAQADAAEGEEGAAETATDATTDEPAAEVPADAAAEPAAAEGGEAETDAVVASDVPQGCTEVKVSTNNALKIVTNDGEEKRVTPFNFIMSGGQLVSPEYNLLENLNDVEGAEVSEFSTWKTVGTVVGVSAVAIGSFVAISLLAGDSSGFSN